jgi:hypothetical protein
VHGIGSRNKLTPSHARHYPGDGLLDVVGRAVCAVHCLPRKELHEAFELARVVRRHFRGGRVVDLCCGQGLLAQLLLLVDDDGAEAIAVDRRLPGNHRVLHDAIAGAFPQLRGRVQFVEGRVSDVVLRADDIVVSSHACGPLTDDVFARAVSASARVAVLPCCHQTRFRSDVAGHADPARVVDDERVERLQMLGQRVAVDAIPAAISPKNRVLLAWPPGHDGVVASAAVAAGDRHENG